MIISDLNHLEVVEANVVGGSFFSYYQNDYVAASFFTNVFIDDNSAVANADSLALGNNSFSKTETVTVVTGGSSRSSSSSFGAVD